MKIDKRKGRIDISIDFISGLKNHELSLLFKQFYPFAIDNTFAGWNNKSTYYGFSPKFKEIEPGTIVPKYEVVWDVDEKGKTTITFNEIK